METTTNVKFWPDAHVSKDAEYVGSFPSGAGSARYDLYLHGDNRVRFVFANDRSATYSMKEVLQYAKGAAQDHLDASLLLAAHRARTPAPSAPAAMSITREQLEAMARKRYESLAHPHAWDRLNDKGRRKQIEALTNALAEGGITVAPPPPPQKSANQREAEKMVKLIRDGMEVQFTHPADRGRIVLLRHINEANEHAVTLMREYITAALATRDEEHRQRFMGAMAEKDHEMRGELEELREACAFSVPIEYRYSVLGTPLTKSERSAAK